jgi:hypothetical protein
MAKIKRFAVVVEVTERHTLFVDARRPGGAVERVMTDEGWREATAWMDGCGADDCSCAPLASALRNAKVVEVRPV